MSINIKRPPKNINVICIKLIVWLTIVIYLPGTRAAVINVMVSDRILMVVVVLHLSLSLVDRNQRIYTVEKNKLNIVHMVNGIQPEEGSFIDNFIFL